MGKVWKKLQRADGDFQGTWDGVQKSNVYHTSNKPTKSDVGLSNVANEDPATLKATMSLDNVTNESKATMFASPTFTGTATGLDKASVGLGNVDNSLFASDGKFKGAITKSDGTAVFDPSDGNFTGKIAGGTASDIKSKAEDAKDAVDGNKSITMVGGSLSIGNPTNGVYPFSVDGNGNLKIQDDEFQALANGTVNCKGNFTIEQDANGDSKIELAGDGSGYATVLVNGANPTFDLGGATPLGTSTLYLKRKLDSNQSRIQFRTGTGTTTNELNIGVSNNTINGRKDQYAIHYGPIWSTGTAHERGLSFDHDGKMGMYANTKTVDGFTFGSDGDNKHVYIKDGGLGVGTTSISDGNVNVSGTVTANAFSGDGSSLTGITDTNTTYSASTGLTLSGTAFSISNKGVDTNQLANGAVENGNIGADAVTGAKIADDAVDTEHIAADAIGEPALNVSGGSTGDILIKNAYQGGGLSWNNSYKRRNLFQFSARMYTRYNYWYYPSTTYGVNNTTWSSTLSSATTASSWNVGYQGFIYVPYACTLKECYFVGDVSNSETYEIKLLKGTPTYNSTTATSLSAISVHSGAVVSGRRVRLGSSSLSTSLAKGDLLVPTFRRTTNFSSSLYRYLDGQFVINVDVS